MNIFSKNIFKLEFKRSFKSLMIWSISLALSLLLVIIIYPMAKDMFEALEQMIEYLESIDSGFIGMLDLFGGIPDNGIEYFATEGAMFLQLLGGIFAALVGFSIINKDEKEKTVEVIYTLPVSRTKLLFTKMVVVAVNLFIFMIIQVLMVDLGFLLVAPGEDISAIWMFGLFDYLMFLMIAYLSMFLALILKPNQSSFIAVAIPFPLYIITTIAYATDNTFLKSLKYISPFTFAEPVGWLKDQADFELINFIIFASLTVVSILFSFILFKKRQMI
ncbi:MAG: ABC transporter permease subunit [Acholeplasmataceae bacterium]|nr:ABC transporter permease subunit [Acholeplasmataceae bacterium]